jgi:hypothetical protein
VSRSGWRRACDALASDDAGLASDDAGLASDDVGQASDDVGLASDDVGLASDDVGQGISVQVCEAGSLSSSETVSLAGS